MTSAVELPFNTLPNWIKAAALCGVDLQRLLDELSLPSDLGRLAESTVTPVQVAHLMTRCVAETRQGHFPFALGETYAFESLPDLETFLATSATLREAATVFDWIRTLVNPLLSVTLREAGNTAWLVVQFLGSDTPTPLQTQVWFTEALFAAILKFSRGLAPEGRDFESLHLRHAAPPYAERYPLHFHLPVHFDARENALRFDRELLDLPLGRSFPRLHAQARERIEAELQRRAGRERLSARIESAFARKPALLGLGASAMASELGLHLRRLQRRLQDEGLCYEALQAATRQRLAMDLMSRPGADLDQVSECLGYADRRSFTRAFKRWTGMTPSEWRRGQSLS